MSIHDAHVLTLACKTFMCNAMSTMARRKKMVTFGIEPELYNRLEAWIARQEFPPTKTTMLELALKRLLDNLEDKKQKERKR